MGISIIVLGRSALAADLPVKAPPVPYVADFDWNGWYVGAHVAVIRGDSDWSATPPGAPRLAGSFNLPFNFDFMAGTGSYGLGLRAGYNHVFPLRVVLGVEADFTAPNSDVLVPYSVQGSQTVTTPATGQVTYNEAVIQYGTVRGRVGYAFAHFLLYGTGGLAWSYDQLSRTQLAAPAVAGVAAGMIDTRLLWRLGWAAGIGVAAGNAGRIAIDAAAIVASAARRVVVDEAGMRKSSLVAWLAFERV